MYEHPATQANLATLRARGAIVLEPGTGALGSPGEWGIGRLPEPPALLAAIEAALAAAAGGDRGGDLDGLRVLVTAGGTREPIDAVRFIGNRSSGRMGFALADEAARRGAAVTVVAANVELARNPAVRYVDVGSAAELGAATAAEFDRCDLLLMAAAVADYRPAAPRADKLKKTEPELELRLERTEDILTGLAARRREGQVLVGFAAETGTRALEYARAKLARKDLDAVVVNDVARPGIGFEARENEVTIVMRELERQVPRTTKAEVAAAVLDAVLSHRSATILRV
jgi:phosphopantothenoylcysteine decarboxylase / phosphopantothenate---cysteine ligase